MPNDARSDFVIVGGVATGPKTAACLARRLPRARITLFEKGEHVSYATCGLPYLVSGDVTTFDQLNVTSYGVKRDQYFFSRSKGFDVVTGAVVTRIDRERKCVTVRDLKTNAEFEHGYGKLVLATGSAPRTPTFPVAESPRVRPFTRPEDAIFIRRAAEEGRLSAATIVGGGPVGCELAEAMRGLWGIETTLIEIEPQLLPYALDGEMAAIVQREMQRNDVCVMTRSAVECIEIGNDQRPVCLLSGGKEIASDIVLLCLGVTPEVSLARDCGLVIGATGAIQVNQFMQTSDPDIFAGGDCVECYHQIAKQKIHFPMGSIANRHGRVIAENLAGHPTAFPGILGAFVVKVFEVNVGAVGLSESAAIRHGLQPQTVWGSFGDKPDYYPESAAFTAKITYCRAGDRLQLLGLQGVGKGDICRRIDAFSAHLQSGRSVEDLLDFEPGYAPPYAEPLDPLHHLAASAVAAARGLEMLSPNLGQLRPNPDCQWLDVREPVEAQAEKWPLPSGGKLINIPLNELVSRLDELDRSQDVIVICKRGPRAYQAALILMNAGFEKVRMIGGGSQAATC